MRIALVLATSAGGVGRHVRSLAAGLGERGARVAVLGPASTEEQFGFQGAGARFRAVDVTDRPRPLPDARAVLRLRRLLRDADVVHAHGLRAGGLAALALGGRRPALAVTLHNAAVAGGMVGWVYAVLERIVAYRADLVLGVSPDLVARARGRGARATGHALVPASPSAAPRKDRAAVRAELSAGERPVVLFVGRLAEQKGLPALLDAAAGWSTRANPPLVLVVGDGPLADPLDRRIEAEGLPVRLLGHRPDVPELLNAADVVVVPSVWEGQPLAVQETLRAGRPLVATRVGGIPAMVGDAALLVPAGDPVALERGVARVLDSRYLAARLEEAARARAATLPTEDDAVERVTTLYRELVLG
ncbi:MAG: glycosyltransferase [Streptosporangiales bacterium]|nr:glycosyltransferase [Streptosporangiales bacterium]